MSWRGIIYNVALLAAICFLCYILGSGWPCLMIFFIVCGKQDQLLVIPKDKTDAD